MKKIFFLNAFLILVLLPVCSSATSSSILCSFKIGVGDLPTLEVIVPKPKIIFPKPGAKINSAAIINGTGLPGNDVELHVESTYTGGKNDFGTYILKVGPDGKWQSGELYFWLPTESADAKFNISAVQMDNQGKRSEPENMSVLPGNDILHIQNAMFESQIETLPAPRGGGEIIVKERNISPASENLETPEVISPKNNSILTGKQDIQLVGKGIPGAEVRIGGEVQYTGSNLYYQQDFSLSAVVGPDGLWVTKKIDPNLPDWAKDITYTFNIMQIKGENSYSWPFDLFLRQKL